MTVAVAVAVITVIEVDITLIMTVHGSMAMQMPTFMIMAVTLDSQVNMEVDITIE